MTSDGHPELDERPARVLVVDDDAAVQTLFARALREAGLDVELASDGQAAEQLFRQARFDVVVSDINMPGLNGLQLLRALRQVDLDLPVILVTGEPSLATAMEAIEYGALRYLAKPVDCDALVETANEAVRMRRLATLRRQLLAHAGDAARQVADRAGLEVRFERALEKLVMVFQPIVDYGERSVLGYEALVRSREPAMAQPGALLDAADRLNRLQELGRLIRSSCAQAMLQAPPKALLFVNLHARELNDDELLDPQSPLAAIAQRVILEITESARLEQVLNLPHRVGRLRSLGFRIALDDIGAGYAGLASFALLQPDIVKLDMGLVRDVHLDATKRKLVGSLMRLCSELGMLVVAEGVEKPGEREGLMSLGCRLFQGHLFAKPAVSFSMPNLE